MFPDGPKSRRGSIEKLVLNELALTRETNSKSANKRDSRVRMPQVVASATVTRGGGVGCRAGWRDVERDVPHRVGGRVDAALAKPVTKRRGSVGHRSRLDACALLAPPVALRPRHYRRSHPFLLLVWQKKKDLSPSSRRHHRASDYVDPVSLTLCNVMIRIRSRFIRDGDIIQSCSVGWGLKEDD